MKKRSFYKTTLLVKTKDDTNLNLKLIEYPTEDLYEDGELDEADVEEKIIWLWRNDKIVIAKWEEE